MSKTVEMITQEVKQEFPLITQVVEEVSRVLVGQRTMTEKLLIGLLTGGHVLVEGVPGLAKTTAIKALAEALGADFNRIQFTPDLLPADLLGTQIYNPKTGEFQSKKGPLFSNIILADEINRAPAKVQSALLEAMQEKQITLGDQTYKLPDTYLVMATQNPVEQEGTYPLPEAQVDRFMLKVVVTYPQKNEEIEVMKRMSVGKVMKVNKTLSPEKISQLRNLVEEIFIDEKLYEYIANLVFATRNPGSFGLGDLNNLVEIGASPRASINLVKASKANAFLQGRGYVTPQDIKTVAMDILRHRIAISYEAEALEMNSDMIVQKILDKVDVP